jgi:hypothetical protein
METMGLMERTFSNMELVETWSDRAFTMKDTKKGYSPRRSRRTRRCADLERMSIATLIRGTKTEVLSMDLQVSMIPMSLGSRCTVYLHDLHG